MPHTEFRDNHVSLAHGNGGRLMRELIDQVFVGALQSPLLDTRADAVALATPPGEELVVTTDGFTQGAPPYPPSAGRLPACGPIRCRGSVERGDAMLIQPKSSIAGSGRPW